MIALGEFSLRIISQRGRHYIDSQLMSDGGLRMKVKDRVQHHQRLYVRRYHDDGLWLVAGDG